jgi:glutamate/tyrosine decarboxylase-like PLP-dependent enzyme
VQYTLECTRSPEAVFSVTGNLLSFGIEGYQVCLGWVIQVSDYLRSRLRRLGHVGILNPDEHGFSTVFRVYPHGTDAQAELDGELNDPSWSQRLERNTAFSQAAFDHRDRRLTVWDAKLDWTSAGTWARHDRQTPLPAWKAYILNPRVRYGDVDRFVDTLERATAECEPSA